jgi:aspartyl/asparaginyl beta-hydroxylase (cupin superfamily)
MGAQPFLEPSRFPQLTVLTDAFEEIRLEALATLPHVTYVADRRVQPEEWGVLPFWLDADDRRVIGDEQCARNRLLAPRTVELLESIGPVEEASFSSLAPGATIAPHRHYRPFVTASLCLAGGDDASITVGGETRPYANGEWLVFDYTQSHSVVNRGPNPRTVLLVLLDARTDLLPAQNAVRS